MGVLGKDEGGIMKDEFFPCLNGKTNRKERQERQGNKKNFAHFAVLAVR
jgi:hypothetical protein